MAERWVINASPVILLAKAGVLDLVPQICGELVIPRSVVAEVAGGVLSDEGRAWISGNGARFVIPSPPLSPALKAADLGAGEAEVLAWALANPGFLAVLDDRQGRNWAAKLGLPFTGSLGVVVILKRRGLIQAARPAIEKIRSAGGYISEFAVNAALAAAGEV